MINNRTKHHANRGLRRSSKDANVDVAVAEAALDASAGWVVDTSSTEGASISLTKNGKTCSTTITVAAGTVSASDASCGAAAGGGAGGGFTLSYTSPIVSFLQSQTSQTVSPIVSNGTAASFSYTGSLPAGVSFDTTTGELTGPSACNFTVAKLAVGTSHTCALTTTGAVKCWGYNGQGQFGDGTTTNSSVPVDITGLASGVASIDMGNEQACALTTSGGVKCWGGTYGLTPVNVSGLTSGVALIVAGKYGTCAVTTSGGAKCWGYNGNGEVGDGTTTTRLTPVNVSGLTSGVVSVNTTSGNAGNHVCAITTGGGAKCWGWNGDGQLGNGSTTSSSSPVNVVNVGPLTGWPTSITVNVTSTSGAVTSTVITLTAS